jgi:MATE family multidrug resistance protein
MMQSESASGGAAQQQQQGPQSTYRQVLVLAYPVVLSMLAQTVMGLVDTLFMGWVSTDAQAAIGLGNTITWAFLCFFVGTLTAVNTVVAQTFGAQKLEHCGAVGWQGLSLAALAALLMLLVTPFVPVLFQSLRSPPAVANIATDYTAIRVAFGGLACIEAALTSFMRGIGDTRTPMKVAIGMMVLNVPLNYLLIFGGLGIAPQGPKGAAIATVAATGIACVVLLALFMRKSWRDKYGTGFAGRKMLSLGQLMRLGVPIGVQWVLEMLSWTVFTVAVASFGSTSMAAHNIVLQCLHVSFMPGVALSVAATTLVGQALGARDKAAARASGYAALRIAVAYMTLMAFIFWLGGATIAGWFNRDPLVIDLAKGLFLLAAVFQMLDACGMVASGILRGAAVTRFPAIVTVICSLFVLLPTFWLFGIHLEGGVIGSWGGATLYIIVLGTVMLVAVKRERWLDANVEVAHSAVEASEGCDSHETVELSAPAGLPAK